MCRDVFLCAHAANRVRLIYPNKPFLTTSLVTSMQQCWCLIFLTQESTESAKCNSLRVLASGADGNCLPVTVPPQGGYLVGEVVIIGIFWGRANSRASERIQFVWAGCSRNTLTLMRKVM